jgi:hypothetical protein
MEAMRHSQTARKFERIERIVNMKLTHIQGIHIAIFQLFEALSSIAQPGDRAFSFVTWDGGGYHNNFKVYSCSVNYPDSSIRSDSLEVVWKPDLKTINPDHTANVLFRSKTLENPPARRARTCK